ncbi:MAG TPA: virulence factor SrfC family protein, partial [Candidatus Ozemobacteraceae bacterium]|nr:virulence factor SrfC family protein [Candidatus Ozemobacteraceae bacterium]
MGSDAKARQGRKNLLFQVFTKFDSDLIWKKGQDPQVRWDSRLKTNFEEFFGKAGTWVEDWDGVTAFQNCYWVRNPNVQQTVFGRDQQGNEFVREETQLNEIMNQYLANELVRRHFKNPQESWKRAASPGHPGIPWLVENVRASVEPLAKVMQLKQNLAQILAGLKSHLQPHFVGDDVAKARQQAEERARKRLAALSKEMAFKYSLPQILDRERFSISDRLVSMVFDRVVNPMNDEAEAASTGGVAQPEAQVFEADIFAVGGDTPAAATPAVPSKAPPRKGETFAQGVLNLWQEQLVRLAKDKTLQQTTGLDADWFAEVTQEIIKGASRLKLSEDLAALSETFLNAPNPGRFVRKTGV